MKLKGQHESRNTSRLHRRIYSLINFNGVRMLPIYHHAFPLFGHGLPRVGLCALRIARIFGTRDTR